MDNPQFFQLPPNIERTLQIINSSRVINQLKVLNVQLTEGSLLVLQSLIYFTGSRFNREKWSTELSPLIGVWGKIMSTSQSALEYKVKANPDASPLDSFVLMECEKVPFLEFYSYLIHYKGAQFSQICK